MSVNADDEQAYTLRNKLWIKLSCAYAYIHDDLDSALSWAKTALYYDSISGSFLIGMLIIGLWKDGRVSDTDFINGLDLIEKSIPFMDDIREEFDMDNIYSGMITTAYYISAISYRDGSAGLKKNFSKSYYYLRLILDTDWPGDSALKNVEDAKEEIKHFKKSPFGKLKYIYKK